MPYTHTKDDESVGKNWIAVGDKNTGKSYLCLMLSVTLFAQGKRIIIFDSRQNLKTYGKIAGYKTKSMNVSDFMKKYANLENDTMTLVTWTSIEEFDEAMAFCARWVRNSCILLDDLGNLYASNPPAERLGIIMTPKNNCNDIFYQIHTFGKACPYLLEMTDVYLIKETAQPKIPEKVPEQYEIQKLMMEIKQENKQRPASQKWSWRMYDKTTGLITRENTDGKIITKTTLEYFD